jgi:transposase
MEVYIGIDWSEKKHDAIYRNEKGEVIYQITFEHSVEGYRELERVREKLGLRVEDCVIGVETAHHILVDYLWECGYSRIYIVPPGMVDDSRGRWRQSGAKDDIIDGWVIADLVLHDHHRLTLWKPDTLLTRQIRVRVKLVRYLTRETIRHGNRLRSVLLRYYPAALVVFRGGVTVPITLAFVQAYPTPGAAQQLSRAEFEEFCRKNLYRQKRNIASCYMRLQQPQPKASQEVVEAYQAEAILLASLLHQEHQAKRKALKDLQGLFLKHADYALYHSLPGAGCFLEPALLAKFGDDRQRFPSASSVQALAGTCPITRRSGKQKHVHYRLACDREFRSIAVNWAKASLHVSVWANLYYQKIRPGCSSENHALRCLANRWLAILWRLWQDHTSYDEPLHLQRHALRAEPR